MRLEYLDVKVEIAMFDYRKLASSAHRVFDERFGNDLIKAR